MDENLRVVWAQTPSGRLCDVATPDGSVDPAWAALALAELTPTTVWVAGRRTWDLLRKNPAIAERLDSQPGILLSRTRLRTPDTTILLHDDAPLMRLLGKHKALILGGAQLIRRYSGDYITLQRIISPTLPATDVNAPQLNGHYMLTGSKATEAGTWEEWKPPKTSSIPGYDLEAPSVRFVTPSEKKKRK